MGTVTYRANGVDEEELREFGLDEERESEE